MKSMVTTTTTIKYSFFIDDVDENGNTSKPFVLPQKDPHFYDFFLKSFNV